MVVLFRTSRPPIAYMTRFCSIASLFRFICLIVKFGGPVLICYFYLGSSQGSRVDYEYPKITPGLVRAFHAVTSNSSYVYPPSSNDEKPEEMIFQSIPTYSTKRLEYWTVLVRIPSPLASSISSLTVLFDFKVELRKWANNTINSIGSFTHSFSSGVNHVSCTGDVTLEQNEIINFRGSLSSTEFNHHPDATNAEILEKQDNMSTLFYVDWDEPLIKYGNWSSFELELKVYVRDVEIWHSIPLVSSIESIIFLYLSTLILFSLILDSFQSCVFRNKYLKVWDVPLCAEPKKYHGSIN